MHVNEKKKKEIQFLYVLKKLIYFGFWKGLNISYNTFDDIIRLSFVYYIVLRFHLLPFINSTFRCIVNSYYVVLLLLNLFLDSN